MAADDNIQIVIPSTPAQLFHVLRRQVLRRWRKPLVVFTPKSLLRHPKVVSSFDDLANGRFERILPDTVAANGRGIKRVLLCSGRSTTSWSRREKRCNVETLRFCVSSSCTRCPM